MRTTALLGPLVVGLLSISFTPHRFPGTPALSIGTYGVCGCDPALSTSPAISLVIHPDNLFYYVNGTDQSKMVDVAGRWELNGKTLTLWSGSSANPIEKWTMDNSCLRSRKGMTFTRLCHLEECR